MAWDVNAVLEFKVVYLVNGQTCMNVLHYHPTNVTASGDVPLLVNNFLQVNGGTAAGHIINQWLPAMSNSAIIQYTSAQAIFPIRYKVQKRTINTPGAHVDSCEAQNVQASFIKNGELGNRHNTGGLRLGGVPSSGYLAGQLNAPYAALLAAMLGDLMAVRSDGIGAVEYDPCILNKVKTIIDGKPHWTITGSSPIVSIDVLPYIRTQRTRTFQRGI